MNYSNIFVIIFFAGVILHFAVIHILELADFRFRKTHASVIPELSEYIDSETIQKTNAYKNARYFLWLPRSVFSLAVTVTLVVSGFYVHLMNILCSYTENAYLTAAFFVVLSSVPESVIDLPFSLIREFKIEKKFGFSNMTFKMWIADEIKGMILSLVLMVPLMCAVMAVLIHMNNYWWILVSCVVLGFSLIISWIYPVLLAPVFNKFLPLEEGELKTRLEALLKKCGFKSSGIFRMDASKRSKHSNAYFTGFGKNKRIVLYDTLIEQLSADEIEAVLGHELGHYKHHHILKKMFVSVPLGFAVTFIMSLFVNSEQLFTGFGFSFDPAAAGSASGLQIFTGIFLMSIIFSDYGIFSGLVSNFFSRRDEFQADAFSAEVCGTGDALITALIKLNRENLSQIEVPGIYSAFYYSHPPLLERIRALKRDFN